MNIRSFLLAMALTAAFLAAFLAASLVFLRA